MSILQNLHYIKKKFVINKICYIEAKVTIQMINGSSHFNNYAYIQLIKEFFFFKVSCKHITTYNLINLNISSKNKKKEKLENELKIRDKSSVMNKKSNPFGLHFIFIFQSVK